MRKLKNNKFILTVMFSLPIFLLSGCAGYNEYKTNNVNKLPQKDSIKTINAITNEQVSSTTNDFEADNKGGDNNQNQEKIISDSKNNSEDQWNEEGQEYLEREAENGYQVEGTPKI